MDEETVADYSQRIDKLKKAISKAEILYESKKTELDELTTEYRSIEAQCKEKFGFEISQLSAKILEHQNKFEAKLDKAEQSYLDLVEKHQNESD
jgi:hypothetical protein